MTADILKSYARTIRDKLRAKPSNPKKWTMPHDGRQYERLQELEHWSAFNFAEFHLFERDKQLARR